MQESIFVQVVTTYWTKTSRGAPLSDRRNQLPDAFELTPSALSKLSTGECYSQIIMREYEDFVPVHTVERFSPNRRFQWSAVSISVLNNNVPVVRYQHDPVLEGAPRRSQRPAVSHELDVNRLLRVKYNSRTSWPTGEWRYEQIVFNILHTAIPSVEMFTIEPEKYINDLADLW
ncbi:MAG: hypothetical protein KF893_13155 [Caldilineaceae bacterium]|nr:hypothetical protein [Caldilineaceae bacterium]